MEPKEFPILEFDPEKKAIINPDHFFKGVETPEVCIFPFYKKVINSLVDQNILHEIGHEKSLVLDPLPLYKMSHKGKSLAVVTPGLGAPFAASMLEFAIGMGCRKIIAVGSCGVLDPSIPADHLIVPSSAIREDGTSYHYFPPSREIAINPNMQTVIKSYLDKKNIKYLQGKTWTTDAFYRETPEKVKFRREEGAVAVEMEAAALAAVADFRGVSLGYILGAGDDVSGLEWDHRNLMKSMGFHEKLFWLAADIATTLL
ncbi:nucleoside phosphorylase [Candidatus Lokiarchaeum ossiferum]|uniref:nucleoside phosphorylase n=1 Tax=Candidatus Lokiarchaeum ossiferum TaxID=2951803 RepID=UPI00352D9D37